MKRAIVAVTLMVAATLATTGPAQAAAAPASVLSTTCTGYVYANNVGSAAGAGGRVHGFAGYEHSDCGNRIYYFEGAGTSWTTRSTSLVGRVVDVAQDNTGTYLLYVISELSGTPELAVAKRTPGGTITRLAIVAPANGSAQGQRGSIVARGGRWLAVWSQAGRTSTDNDLYQFGTLYGSPGASSPVAIGTGNDMAPALTFAPDGAVIMAFTRTQSAGKVVRVARTTNGSTWSWRTAGSGLPINPDFASLDLAVTSAGTFVSWTERVNFISQVVVADDLTGTWRRQQPPAVYDSANWDGSIVASGSRVMASYSSGDEYPNDTVLIAKRTTATGSWTEVPADTGPVSIDSKGVAGLSLYGSTATALVASGEGLYAVTGLTL